MSMDPPRDTYPHRRDVPQQARLSRRWYRKVAERIAQMLRRKCVDVLAHPRESSDEYPLHEGATFRS